MPETADTMRVLPMGDSALLVECADIAAVLGLEARLALLVAGQEDVWAAVDELVPAARTLLLIARPNADLNALGREVRAVARTAATAEGTPTTSTQASGTTGFTHRVAIPVRYDGPDLAEVARLVGLTPGEVARAHAGTPWQVGFGGFAPGFAYLVGGDPRIEVPRRAEPRTRVPAGAVGLAGPFSAIYPRVSPGGWQLIGTTDVVLWDADRDPPALLTPGTAVQFVDAGGH